MDKQSFQSNLFGALSAVTKVNPDPKKMEEGVFVCIQDEPAVSLRFTTAFRSAKTGDTLQVFSWRSGSWESLWNVVAADLAYWNMSANPQCSTMA